MYENIFVIIVLLLGIYFVYRKLDKGGCSDCSCRACGFRGGRRKRKSYHKNRSIKKESE